MDSTVKRCGKCCQTKPVTEFNKNSRTKSGFTCYCKVCLSIEGKERRAKNVEKERERHRVYRRANKDKSAASSARYRAKYPERLIEQRKRYRANQAPETRNLPSLRWAKNNRAKVREIERRYKRNRRVRKAKAGGTFTEAEFQEKLQQYKGRCHWCRKVIQGRPHRDHLIALSKGGSNDIGNIVPSCGPCNHKKTHLMPWEFMEGRLL